MVTVSGGKAKVNILNGFRAFMRYLALSAFKGFGLRSKALFIPIYAITGLYDR